MNRRELLRATSLLVGGSLVERGFAAGLSAPVAETRTGRVRGVRDRGIAVFKGIPYGSDTSARRFMPPEQAAIRVRALFDRPVISRHTAIRSFSTRPFRRYIRPR